MNHTATSWVNVHQHPIRSAWIGVALTLLILLPIWYGVGQGYKASLLQKERANMASEMSARANALTSAMNQRITLLEGLYAFTRTEWPGTNFDEPFEIYCSGFYFNATGVRTLMIAPEGIARYIFPLYDSQILKGYDILNDSDPSTRADVQRAIHTHVITLGQPGPLRQGGFGLTAWKAVFRGKELWGIVSLSLDLNSVLEDAGIHPTRSAIALRDSAENTFAGSSQIWQQDPLIQKITLPEGYWEIGAVPEGGWQGAIRTPMLFFYIAGLLLILLLATIVYLVIVWQGQLYRQAEQLAILSERQRLSRELHDSLLQVFYSIGLGAKTARAALEHGSLQVNEAIEYIEWLAEAGQVEMRALIFDLRPESLEVDGLISALEKQINVLKARHKIIVTTDLCPEPELPIAIKQAIYRIFKEATQNLIKHAHATQATIHLSCSPKEIQLEVFDNGDGFDPSATYPGHFGLQSMYERASEIGGNLTINSNSEHGTQIRLVIPLSKKTHL